MIEQRNFPRRGSHFQNKRGEIFFVLKSFPATFVVLKKKQPTKMENKREQKIIKTK